MNEFTSKSLLFNTTQAAREIVYYLRGKWDGCNGVVFSDGIDQNTLRSALAIEFCRQGEYCTLFLPPMSVGKSHFWFFDIRENYCIQEASSDELVENNPQVVRLLAQLEPGSLLLNTYNYRLSPEIESAFWRIALHGRKYGIQTIKVETREQGQAIANAICDCCKIIDLFDYQVQN